jgi:hypothetical protein
VCPREEISQDELVKEILNVMIAVPSVNFILDIVSCYCVFLKIIIVEDILNVIHLSFILESCFEKENFKH